MSFRFEEERVTGHIPEWVVTFGDMMSLLLTFFIMLVSLSEIKEHEKYQALVESIRRQFGYTHSQASLAPGESRPRNSNLSKLATLGRAKRQDTANGGDQVEAPVGEHARVQIVRPGVATAVGTVVFFQPGSQQLTAHSKQALRQQASVFKGKPQKIEVRGHTSRSPTDVDNAADHWDLAYGRCREIMNFLVDSMDISAARIRLSVAGPHEPMHLGTDPLKMKQNPRVEVFVLDEVVERREFRNPNFENQNQSEAE